ncbi:MAG: hypothetical protein ACP5MM_09170 [Acidithiobacillus sp.]
MLPGTLAVVLRRILPGADFAWNNDVMGRIRDEMRPPDGEHDVQRRAA